MNNSEVIKTSKNEKLIKRMAQWSDIESMHRLANAEEYDIGLHNLKLYYETSPTSWYVVENQKGELVAYDTYNQLPISNMRHGFQLMVREDYRGCGLTRAFNTMHYSTTPSIGNATADSLLRYKFEKFGEKLLGYEGMMGNHNVIKPSIPMNCSIVPLDHSKLKEFLSYDYSIVGFDRSSFITEWAIPSKYPCKTLSLVAEKNGNICGYGIIRECLGYMTISPLYADDDNIAEWLLYELTRALKFGDKLYVFFSAKNLLLTRWSHKMNFICCDCELRDYIGEVPKKDAWDMSRVYTLHDYYPV